jgi:hypothetical protein
VTGLAGGVVVQHRARDHARAVGGERDTAAELVVVVLAFDVVPIKPAPGASSPPPSLDPALASVVTEDASAVTEDASDLPPPSRAPIAASRLVSPCAASTSVSPPSVLEGSVSSSSPQAGTASKIENANADRTAKSRIDISYERKGSRIIPQNRIHARAPWERRTLRASAIAW